MAAHPKADRIEILWPSGRRQTLTDVKANQIVKVREGVDVEHAEMYTCAGTQHFRGMERVGIPAEVCATWRPKVYRT